MFIDLHGHTSSKNIFTYGPDFETGNSNYYMARLLPKLLDLKSDYFKYDHCSFKLDEYKVNTARGYFLSQVGVMAYTVEASYAIYTNANK